MQITNFDLTDYSVRDQMRKSAQSTTPLAFTFDIDLGANWIIWHLSPEVSAALVPGVYQYQIELFQQELETVGAQGHQHQVEVTIYNKTLLMGTITVEPEISK